jgi:hypothetical protein
MASRNPFGNLNINRDSDDDQEFVKVTAKTTTSASNFTSTTEMKKKKKVRPAEEKTKTEEFVEVSSEGFEVVGKIKKPYTTKNIAEEGEENKKDNKEYKKKGTSYHDKNHNKARPEKRQYDKKSGTGRGKETSKNGAGGKTVWGDNAEQIARQAKKEGGRDDYCKFFKLYNLFFS